MSDSIKAFYDEMLKSSAKADKDKQLKMEFGKK